MRESKPISQSLCPNLFRQHSSLDLRVSNLSLVFPAPELHLLRGAIVFSEAEDRGGPQATHCITLCPSLSPDLTDATRPPPPRRVWQQPHPLSIRLLWNNSSLNFSRSRGRELEMNKEGVLQVFPDELDETMGNMVPGNKFDRLRLAPPKINL